MSSIIIADDTGAYDGTSLETKALGGTESSVVRFARAMVRRGHEVTAYTNCEKPIEDHGVTYLPLSGARPETCDLYIACQHPRLFGFVRRPKRIAVWALWQPNEFKHYKQWPTMIRHRPIPVLISLHQVNIYSPVLPKRNPHIVIPHALPDDIRGMTPLPGPPSPEAIFASNPTRNLHGLIRIWVDRILPACSNAILNIYGIHGIKHGEDPFETWGGGFLPNDLTEAQRASLRIHPTTSREELMAAVRHSRVMLYLGHKVEAFCLAVAEAQAMGVPCVVSSLTVLPERVKHGRTGYVHDDPAEFARAAVSILTDDAEWRRLHEASLALQQGISWDEHAARFEAALLSDVVDTNRSWLVP